MLKIAPGHGVRHPHASARPATPVRHSLESFAGRAAARLAACQCTILDDGCDPPFLMIERPAGADIDATWLVSIASPAALRLEVMVGEVRLQLLAEGPPDRLLAYLADLATCTPAGA